MKYFLWINSIVILILTGYHIYNFNNEKKYVKEILEYIKDDILRKRLTHDLNWYIQRIYYYKYVYYLLSITIMEINSIIPVLNTSLTEEKRVTISLISVMATIFAGIISFTKCSESWIKHRNTYENMKYEVENYINKVDIYNNENKAKDNFYKRYDELKYKSLNQWSILRKEENRNNDKKIKDIK
ncbi:DUF4231 domain-containing protein [Clostridium botulinum]|nr:DUF4231 domain-containing protein [Clostridium botulinum]